MAAARGFGRNIIAQNPPGEVGELRLLGDLPDGKFGETIVVEAGRPPRLAVQFNYVGLEECTQVSGFIQAGLAEYRTKQISSLSDNRIERGLRRTIDAQLPAEVHGIIRLDYRKRSEMDDSRRIERRLEFCTCRIA